MDNFNIVSLKGLSGGFKIAKQAIEILQKNNSTFNSNCEPQLKKEACTRLFLKKKC